MKLDASVIKELKHALEQEHERIVVDLKSIAKQNPDIKDEWGASFPKFESGEYGSHSSLDEEADEVEEYETRLEAEHSLVSRLLEINKALDRIARGTYGTCARCGKTISVERLHANPAAEFDMEHGK